VRAENPDEGFRGGDPRTSGRGTFPQPGSADARSAGDQHGADTQRTKNKKER